MSGSRCWLFLMVLCKDLCMCSLISHDDTPNNTDNLSLSLSLSVWLHSVPKNVFFFSGHPHCRTCVCTCTGATVPEVPGRGVEGIKLKLQLMWYDRWANTHSWNESLMRDTSALSILTVINIWSGVTTWCTLLCKSGLKYIIDAESGYIMYTCVVYPCIWYWPLYLSSKRRYWRLKALHKTQSLTHLG